jgi:rhodanese-related sulfurtransferase
MCRTPIRPLIVLAAALVLAGCGRGETSDRDVKLVELGEAEELVAIRRSPLGIGAERRGVWLDARTPQAYRAGHVPGALNIPYASVREEHQRIRGYDVVIVYGERYNDPIAVGMSKTLRELKYKNIRTLRGGFQAWENAGRPIEKGDGADSAAADG